MQWVDLVLAAVLAISVIVGLVRGFVFEMLSLVGWVVAYVAANWFSADVAPLLPVGTPGSAANHALAFALVFVGVLLLWSLTAKLLRFLIHATPLSLPDRSLGGLFGLLRGLLLLLVAATLISMSPLASAAPWQSSMGAQWLAAGLEALHPLLPTSLSNHLPPPRAAR